MDLAYFWLPTQCGYVEWPWRSCYTSGPVPARQGEWRRWAFRWSHSVSSLWLDIDSCCAARERAGAHQATVSWMGGEKKAKHSRAYVGSPDSREVSYTILLFHLFPFLPTHVSALQKLTWFICRLHDAWSVVGLASDFISRAGPCSISAPLWHFYSSLPRCPKQRARRCAMRTNRIIYAVTISDSSLKSECSFGRMWPSTVRWTSEQRVVLPTVLAWASRFFSFFSM